MQKLIERYKTYRKRKYITSKPQNKYAFVGMGNHSINNLYPVINYFNLDLKYIVSRNQKNAELINDNFSGIIGTNDLDKVLSDSEISGVFISANPESHFQLIQKVLKADKHVFVEKPPCANINELHTLIELEKNSKGQCLIGLQKQYAPSYSYIKKKVNKASYNYRFVTGFYPEGNSFLDLFIHPISLSIFLWGKIESFNINRYKSKTGETIFLQLVHQNGSIGSLELSTDYSWTNPFEELIVNASDNIYKLTNTELLEATPKNGSIMGIPKEKIFKTRNTSFVIEQRNNFTPIMQNNQLYSSGYYSETESFIELCEKGSTVNNSSLESSVGFYELIDKINKSS